MVRVAADLIELHRTRTVGQHHIVAHGLEHRLLLSFAKRSGARFQEFAPPVLKWSVFFVRDNGDALGCVRAHSGRMVEVVVRIY